MTKTTTLLAAGERELVTVDRGQPVVTSEQLELVRKTVANGATDAELKLYLFDCQRRGIHPLDKLLHFTKRSGRYTPVTSIDFMRSQAAMSGEMAGSDDPRFEAGPEYPLAATVTVYRLTQGQRFAYAATARWSEYCPDTAPMWKRMPHTMLGKCAEALALRKAFPQQLAGLYTFDEMAQADNGPARQANGDSVDLTTGEVFEMPEPPAPAGYEAWWTVLQAMAGDGLRAIKVAFNESKPEYRTYLTKTNAAGWEALKVQAGAAKATT